VGPNEGNGYLVLLCLLYLMMILEICALQETHEIVRKSTAPIQLDPLNFSSVTCNTHTHTHKALREIPSSIQSQLCEYLGIVHPPILCPYTFGIR
jgi:hypothetical protein